MTASANPLPKAYLSRRYHLSASHRLHSDAFTAAENRAAYGKCNNPHGHGHNYIIEVTVAGPVDPVTGMVCDLAQLDAFAQTNLLDRFDAMNLNTLDTFRSLVPTTENFTIEVHRIFQRFPGAKLARVHIEETGNNSFEYLEQFSCYCGADNLVTCRFPDKKQECKLTKTNNITAGHPFHPRGSETAGDRLEGKRP